MNKQETFNFYQKLYFHEADAKDKLSSRLQIPLAILISITSVYAYALKGVSLDIKDIYNVFFILVLLVSLSCHALSVFYFIKSFSGHVYEFIPSAIESEKYRKKLIILYEEFINSNQLVSDAFQEYLYKYYCECSSLNTSVNDKRSNWLYKSNTYTIYNMIPLVLVFVIFTFSGIDKNKTQYQVRIVSPINIETSKEPLKIFSTFKSEPVKVELTKEWKELIMITNRKPPAAPTPPPKRVVIENMKQVSPPKDKEKKNN